MKWSDSLSTKQSFKMWWRGVRIKRSKRYTSINEYWRKQITPPRTSEAWFQIVRGYDGQQW